MAPCLNNQANHGRSHRLHSRAETVRAESRLDPCPRWCRYDGRWEFMINDATGDFPKSWQPLIATRRITHHDHTQLIT